MAPSNLQGLNVVHTAPSRDYASDSQDLLDFPAYRDFGPQLELWTNLTFESDESFLRKGENRSAERVKSSVSDDGADDDDETAAKESDMLYPGDAHENIVTGIPLSTQNTPAAAVGSTNASNPPSTQPGVPVPLDLSSFLASFGIDPYGLQAQQLQQNAPSIPTLAQLLTLPTAVASQVTLPAPAAAATSSSKQGDQSASPPASKRARTTKSSSTAGPTQEIEPSPDSSASPVSQAEDKRRRNTAASARFRLKKKEREAALEKRAKELETKVNELEKECEGLRRENGWLKGLVVGVTGGVAQQQAQSVEVKAGAKRGRDEDEDEDLDR